jgi:predicted lipoprotein with Yx(FWY)xxD motif
MSGISGTFGTITRSDGSTQATFDGHPLYTFIGDSAPGQAAGNGLNADGGVWHWAKVSAGATPAQSASSSSSSGYGY